MDEHELTDEGIWCSTHSQYEPREELTVEKLARAIHQGRIHMAHGDPEEQARRILHALDNPEPD